MTVLPATVTGTGLPVLVVHGIGIGAASYLPLTQALRDSACVIVPDRRGYGVAAGMSLAGSCEQHVDDLLDTVESLGTGPAVWLGVSGGATLGLLACTRRPDRIRSAVLHEPLLGPLASRLHEQVVARRDALRADPTPEGAVTFIRALVGERSWGLLDDVARDAVAVLADVVRTEVDMFVDVAFDPDELAALADRCRIISSLGSESPPARDDVARLLAAMAGAEIEVVPGGHLAPVESPAAMSALVWRSLTPAEPRTGSR